MRIAVDWGTSRLRAYLLDEAGAVAATTESDKGLMQVPAGGYAAVLAEVIAPWREAHGDRPVLMSGMVGSRQGWVEVPYVGLPASLDDLAKGTVPVKADGFSDLAIVPGIAAGTGGEAWGDVMRGEETEIFGVLAALGRTGGTFVLPGSHAKWVRVKDDVITGFETFMTGEVFEALARHTILSRMMPLGERRPEAFARGVTAARGLGAPGALLTRLFNIRAETLLGRLDEGDAADFLSGLLIGAEVEAAARGVDEVVVVGAAGLAARYLDALDQMDIAAVNAPPHAAAAGLKLIMERRAAR